MNINIHRCWSPTLTLGKDLHVHSHVTHIRHLYSMNCDTQVRFGRWIFERTPYDTVAHQDLVQYYRPIFCPLLWRTLLFDDNIKGRHFAVSVCKCRYSLSFNINSQSLSSTNTFNQASSVINVVVDSTILQTGNLHGQLINSSRLVRVRSPWETWIHAIHENMHKNHRHGFPGVCGFVIMVFTGASAFGFVILVFTGAGGCAWMSCFRAHQPAGFHSQSVIRACFVCVWCCCVLRNTHCCWLLRRSVYRWSSVSCFCGTGRTSLTESRVWKLPDFKASTKKWHPLCRHVPNFFSSSSAKNAPALNKQCFIVVIIVLIPKLICLYKDV